MSSSEKDGAPSLEDPSQVVVMKDMIQSLCQTTNLLGKTIDFLKEDIETMAKEQQFWIKDRESYEEQLEEERRITKEMLEDEIGQQTELEEEIKYQERRIFWLKGEILRNDETIMKILRLQTNVDHSS